MTRKIYNKYSCMEVKRILEKKGILILRYADKDEYVFYDKILNLLVKGSKTTVETEISRELGIYCKIVEDAYKAHKKTITIQILFIMKYLIFHLLQQKEFVCLRINL